MAKQRDLFDTFADVQRTLVALVGLQADVLARTGNLEQTDLIELEQRVEAHRAAIDTLAAALGPVLREALPAVDLGAQHTGISNRESAQDEIRERQMHPPLDTDSPAPEDAAGRVGEQPLNDTRNRHTSHKAGSRSLAQKEAASRYPDRSMPASRKVAGAFGKEPRTAPDRDSPLAPELEQTVDDARPR